MYKYTAGNKPVEDKKMRNPFRPRTDYNTAEQYAQIFWLADLQAHTQHVWKFENPGDAQ